MKVALVAILLTGTLFPAERHLTLSGTDAPIAEAAVAIVLVPALEDPAARAMIMRSPAKAPFNFVLVTSETNPHDLSRAIYVLQQSRRTVGDRVERELRTYIRRSTNGKQTQNVSQAAHDLRLLREAAPFEVPGIGVYPTVISSLGSLER